MKKILFLLLSTVAMYGQVPADATPLENIQITNNITDNSATKVNVQSTDGTINTISKSDLVNVVEVNDVPSLPLIGEVGKIYVVKNLNEIYRWNGTFYQELTTDISGKEDIANKQNSLAVDLTNLKYPTVTAVNTGLALKADLASPALTGTPTAPTATAGTNTTQIATTAFVQAGLNLKSNLSDITLQRAYDTSTDKKIQTLAIRPFTLKAQTAASSDNVFVIENSSGFTVASVGAQGKLWAVSASVEGDVTGNFFIKRSTPINNILLAGGADLAQGTAFNKNFGTAAGTVAQGNDSRILNGKTAFGWGNHAGLYSTITGSNINQTSFRTALGLGSNAYSSTAYLPLSGGDLTGALNGTSGNFSSSVTAQNALGNAFSAKNTVGGFIDVGVNDNATSTAYVNYSNSLAFTGGAVTFSSTVTATSYTATSLPVFENNAAASSLAVGQFYRTSTGVLMVKF